MTKDPARHGCVGGMDAKGEGPTLLSKKKGLGSLSGMKVRNTDHSIPRRGGDGQIGNGVVVSSLHRQGGRGVRTGRRKTALE